MHLGPVQERGPHNPMLGNVSKVAKVARKLSSYKNKNSQQDEEQKDREMQRTEEQIHEQGQPMIPGKIVYCYRWGALSPCLSLSKHAHAHTPTQESRVPTAVHLMTARKCWCPAACAHTVAKYTAQICLHAHMHEQISSHCLLTNPLTLDFYVFMPARLDTCSPIFILPSTHHYLPSHNAHTHIRLTLTQHTNASPCRAEADLKASTPPALKMALVDGSYPELQKLHINAYMVADHLIPSYFSGLRRPNPVEERRKREEEERRKKEEEHGEGEDDGEEEAGESK